jgi:hypothetical protein
MNSPDIFSHRIASISSNGEKINTALESQNIGIQITFQRKGIRLRSPRKSRI